MTITLDSGTPYPGAPRTPATPPPRIQHDLPAGHEVPLIAPGSDEWFTTISASKVAAIVGLSPYDSPLSLWAKMRGTVAREPQTAAMSRGHYLEPAVAAWFRDQHPDWTVRPSGTFVAAANERFTCSPDRLIYGPHLADGVVDLLQIKSTTKDHEWGQPGTDQVPPDYRAQVMWEMGTVGASRCHVATIGSFLEFAEYVVDFDPDHYAQLVAKATAFLDMIDNGVEPTVDSHGATFATIRELHPVVDDGLSIEVDETLARRYVTAINERKAAEVNETGAKTAILDALGDAKTATYAGKKLAERRASRPGATPTLYAAKVLPTFAATIAAPGEVDHPAAPAGESLPGAVPTVPVDVQSETATSGSSEAPTGSPTETVRTVGERDGSPTTLRTDWILGRLKAVVASGDPVAITKIQAQWPTDVPAKAPWTDADIDAIHDVLHAIELSVDALGFPPPDPTKPSPDQELAAKREARVAAEQADDAANITRRTGLDDNQRPATKAQASDLKATVAAMDDPAKHLIVTWSGDAERAGKPWAFDKTSTGRIAHINAAAFACALHLDATTDDGVLAVRFAIEKATGLTLSDTWSIGAVLGCLTSDEAQRLTSIATRFGAGDDEIVHHLGDRLANHWAAHAAS